MVHGMCRREKHADAALTPAQITEIRGV